jgi:predicted nucleic acid-binding protein
MTMAVAGEVEYLATGDHRAGLLQRGHVGRTRIVTPAAFCAVAL